MFPLGFLTLVTGTWLLDSAVQNRPPIQTIVSIVRNPSGIYTTLAATKGSAFAPATVIDNGPQTADTSAASGTGNTGVKNNASSSSGGHPGNSAVSAAIAFATAQKGKPYKWGATGPNAYDCSGLVQQSYKAGGVSLPRTTAGMILVGSKVTKANLLPGDLVFPDVHHVQLYIGNGEVIEAPRTGETVRQVAMWGFFTARRVA